MTASKMTMKQMIRLEQAQRMEHCPENRIPWYSSETAAINDRYVLMRYMTNYKTGGFREIIRACRDIEKNNYLPAESIAPERFMLVAASLGYDPYSPYAGEEDEDE